MSTQLPPARLNNVFAGMETEQITGKISKDVHRYFIRHVLAGDRGCIQGMISKFFEQLHLYCRDTALIPEIYDEDNERRIAIILSQLNFRPEVAHSRTDPPRRRSVNVSAKPPGKPAANPRNRRAAGSDSPKSPHGSSDSLQAD